MGLKYATLNKTCLGATIAAHREQEVAILPKSRIRLIVSLLTGILLIGVLLMTGCGGNPGAVDGNTVQVHYTGTLADGSVFDSSVGKSPLEFEVGAGQMIPGFDAAVHDMKVGDVKTVTIPAAEAYGERREDQTAVVPRTSLPEGMTPTVGMQLEMSPQGGGSVIVTVSEVTDETITVDGNHPLAGKDLTFEIEVVSIN
jgi:peptidylprolyl isomerase